MDVIQFTDSNVFNAMFSLFFYLTVILAPAFAVLGLLRN